LWLPRGRGSGKAVSRGCGGGSWCSRRGGGGKAVSRVRGGGGCCCLVRGAAASLYRGGAAAAAGAAAVAPAARRSRGGGAVPAVATSAGGAAASLCRPGGAAAAVAAAAAWAAAGRCRWGGGRGGCCSLPVLVGAWAPTAFACAQNLGALEKSWEYGDDRDDQSGQPTMKPTFLSMTVPSSCTQQAQVFCLQTWHKLDLHSRRWDAVQSGPKEYQDSSTTCINLALVWQSPRACGGTLENGRPGGVVWPLSKNPPRVPLATTVDHQTTLRGIEIPSLAHAVFCARYRKHTLGAPWHGLSGSQS